MLWLAVQPIRFHNISDAKWWRFSHHINMVILFYRKRRRKIIETIIYVYCCVTLLCYSDIVERNRKTTKQKRNLLDLINGEILNGLGYSIRIWCWMKKRNAYKKTCAKQFSRVLSLTYKYMNCTQNIKQVKNEFAFIWIYTKRIDVPHSEQ